MTRAFASPLSARRPPRPQAELRLLESDDELTRQAAVHAARELLRCQRDKVAQFTEHVMLRWAEHQRAGAGPRWPVRLHLLGACLCLAESPQCSRPCCPAALLLRAPPPSPCARASLPPTSTRSPPRSPLRRRLLASHRDTSREVCLAAEECLELVVATSEPRRCLAVLIPVAAREETPVLQASAARSARALCALPAAPLLCATGPPALRAHAPSAAVALACSSRPIAVPPLHRPLRRIPPRAQASIRLISRIVPRMSAAELQLLLPQLLPPLFDAFKSPSADVRKAVVFALVDMYLVLGDELTPHLSELSTSQLKLVTIYINRTTKARAENPPVPVST